MIDIVTWNIQAGKGVDGAFDLDRIARVARGWGEPDVLCLQEVARFVPEIAPEDQVEILSRLFPGYAAIFGAAVDRAGPAADSPRCQFGNVVLSRLPVHEVFLHPLPQPADPAVKHMPRQATEVVVAAPSGPLRVVTTHFEFHSEAQRRAQANRLVEIQREVLDNAARPPHSAAGGLYGAPIRPPRCVMCGDFNAVAESAVYDDVLGAAGDRAFLDAWVLTHAGAPHDPTCGIFDGDQWPEGPHCRDFFFVTPDLAPLSLAVDVNVETDASDHQPLRLKLAV